MDLAIFYAVLSATCLTLVGLWWSVLDHRPHLLGSPAGRRTSGGVLLSFLLPGAMGLFAQVAPSHAWVWRVSFAVASAIGVASSAGLARRDPAGHRLNQPLRWAAPILYAVVLVIAAAPSVVAGTGLSGREAAGLVLVLLVLIGHGLAWAQLTGPGPTGPEETADPASEGGPDPGRHPG